MKGWNWKRMDLANGEKTSPKSHLEKIRYEEVIKFKKYFSAGSRVLEIGGGNGFQAAIIASLGCQIYSIDLADRKMKSVYFPVQEYDGIKFPFPDSMFDIVFSSSVLEHVNDVPGIFREIHRVLEPDGISVHIVPTPKWRFWTNITYYFYAMKKVFGIDKKNDINAGISIRDKVIEKGFFYLLRRLVPEAHGHYSNAWLEICKFREKNWSRIFRENGFEILSNSGNGLFYTGYQTFPVLSINFRRALSRILGSVCNCYIIKSCTK